MYCTHNLSITIISVILNIWYIHTYIFWYDDIYIYIHRPPSTRITQAFHLQLDILGFSCENWSINPSMVLSLSTVVVIFWLFHKKGNECIENASVFSLSSLIWILVINSSQPCHHAKMDYYFGRLYNRRWNNNNQYASVYYVVSQTLAVIASRHRFLVIYAYLWVL